MNAKQGIEPYPIEIDAPDILNYQKGNCGIPYLYQFDSGVSGPHVMVNALTHGNEYCGAIAVKELLDMNFRPRRGKITLCFANYHAYLSFDPENPDASRFVDRDLNRVWEAHILDDLEQDCIELRRARELRPIIDSVDLLLDLHSMHEKSDALMLSGPLQKGIEFAQALALPPNIIVDNGHKEGKRLRDYADFGNPNSNKNALLVECGQHWEAASEHIARQCVYRFLMVAGTIDADDLPDIWKATPSANVKTIEVTDAIVATSMNFAFKEEYRGLEIFSEPGAAFATLDDEVLTTPYPDCVLVMPSIRQLRPGVTVVRLGKLIS